MTVQSEVKHEYSPFFSQRFEHANVILLSNRPQLEQILSRHGFEKRARAHVATTYFSNNPGASIWQWPEQTRPDSLVIVRFRQRFDEDPIKNNAFLLQGGGDLEFKIHNSDHIHNAKLSIHISEEVGIEKLVELSHSDPYNFWNTLAVLSQKTCENNINPLALVAHIHNGITPLVTRTSMRDTYLPTQNESKVTVDTEFNYCAFPFWNINEPTHSAVPLVKRSDVLNVEVKAREKTDEVSAMIDEIIPMSTTDQVRSGKTYAELREMALKNTGRIIKEQSSHEIEAKLNVEVTDDKLTLDDVLKRLYTSAASGQLPHFRISPQFPDIANRTAESALYSTYGWIDLNKNIHEVLTVIQVKGNPPTFWIKRKGDPQTAGMKSTMIRTEKIEKLKNPPDMVEVIAKEVKKVGKDIIKIGNFTKRKIAFKVQEIDTGRMFTVSLDEDRMEGAQDLEPLRQLEIEYAETPQENIKLIPADRTIQNDCDQLQFTLSLLNLDGVKLTPTSERKIEWLYRNTQKLPNSQT